MNKGLVIGLIIVGVIGFGTWTLTQKSDNSSQNGLTPAKTQTQPLTTESSQGANSKYIEYSEEALAANQDKRKLLFFHANWCPTCKAAEKEILGNLDKLPEDLVIIKTNYDTETALKKKYNITYQHTFVLIDNQGNQLKQWNGGGVAAINQQV